VTVQSSLNGIDQRPRWQRNLRLYPWFYFFHDLQFWLPLWIVFAIDGVGLSWAEIGAIGPAFYVITSFGQAPAGAIADRFGRLRVMRASLVNAEVLAVKAQTLSLGDWLRMGRGEERSGGRGKPSILAAAYEAVLGAIYLDGGFPPVTLLVAKHFAEDLQETERMAAFDSKTRLQEITQKIFKQTPSYEVIKVNGPDHEKRFVSQVSIAGEIYGRGEGRSKKRAHQAAASQTLELLKHKNLTSLKDV